ncbi:MAG TPA: hypothetical protein VK553_08550, partial [Candidatus Nitrosopolaris rasttigaisensis]|nr:hypothetical protein [Candidatus Nitrosopolaris rasttigaisensis]
MKNINQINLFISCTNEIKEEIDSIKLIVEEINKTSGKQNGYIIASLNWNLDTYTQIGEDAQEVINNQLGSGYDILVALLWQRIGTPTKRHKSGTIEEISNAIDKRKEFLIYFKTTPPDNLNLIDLKQLAKINSFKDELKGKGVLYKEFNKIDGFESLFRINVLNLINDKFLDLNARQHKTLNDPIIKDRYGSISSLIELVESKEQDPAISLDTFQLVEQIVAYFQRVTSSLISMTAIYNGLTAKMSARTVELNRLKAIKDNSLRLHKTEIVIDLFADE